MRDPDERAHDDPDADHPTGASGTDAQRPPVTARLPVVAPGSAESASADPGRAEPARSEAAADVADAEPQPVRAESEREVAPVPSLEPIMVTQRVAVVRLSGANDGEVTPITSDTIIIGRLADDLTITLRRDPWVSRRHASVRFHDNGWWLEDLNSSNGTYLGEEREKVTQPTSLPLNEVFRVGHTDLMLSDDSDYLSQGAQRV